MILENVARIPQKASTIQILLPKYGAHRMSRYVSGKAKEGISAFVIGIENFQFPVCTIKSIADKVLLISQITKNVIVGVSFTW